MSGCVYVVLSVNFCQYTLEGIIVLCSCVISSLCPPPHRSPGSSLQGSQEEGTEIVYTSLLGSLKCALLAIYCALSMGH